MLVQTVIATSEDMLAQTVVRSYFSRYTSTVCHIVDMLAESVIFMSVDFLVAVISALVL